MAVQTGTPITVFASAVYSATQTSTIIRSGLQAGEGYTKGLVVIADCTLDAASASVVFTVQVATGNGAFATVATMAALDTVDTVQQVVIHPDVANDIANFTDQGPMATKWQVVATHADGDDITYSVIAFPLT